MESVGNTNGRRMSTSTPYPNGQVLVSSALTIQQINAIVQPLTCGMLGINPPNFAAVRIDWPTQGQPFIDLPNKDVCFISCVPENVDYAKVRDQSFSGTGTVTETWVYTRGWRIAWTLYGPNSTDCARQIYSAVIFMDYFSNALSLVNLYPVAEAAEPTRIPEQFNAEWWERADFHITAYEQITETIQDTAVTSVEGKIYDGSANDPVADITVTT